MHALVDSNSYTNTPLVDQAARDEIIVSTCAKLISYSHRLKRLSNAHSRFLKYVINLG